MGFRGGQVQALDAKGRVTVPNALRADLTQHADAQGQVRLVLTKGLEGCLRLYPLAGFEAFEAALRKLPQEAAPWRRFFLGEAADVEIDSAGRVLIPPHLREFAGLDKEVKFSGVSDCIELWDRARYAAKDAETLAQALPPSMAQLVVG